MRATIKDLSRFTGLSVGTISKYINGGRIKPDNAKKIKEAIITLDFQVNETARGLKTNRSKMVGIIIPSLDNYFSTSLISSIEFELAALGYSVMIFTYREDSDREREILKFLISKNVDGIVLVPSADYETVHAVDSLIKMNIPVISVDRKLAGSDADEVVIDNYDISYQVTNYLIEMGHENIAIICGPKEVSTAAERLSGYEDALMNNHINLNGNFVQFGDYYSESAYNSTKLLLNLSVKPTVIFGTNYDTTLGIIQAINELELKFPDDISIVGFDGLGLTKIVTPILSTVVQPMEEIAHQVTSILIERIGKKVDRQLSPIKKELKAALIVGDSVGKLN